MDDVIEDRLSMFEKVATFLNANSAALSATPIIGSSIQPGITNLISLILTEAGDAGAPTTGQTEAKQNMRTEVETKGLALAGAGYAYFTIAVADTNKRSLCRFTKTDLMGKRDNDLFADLRKMHQTVDPVKTLLAPYGFTGGQVDDYGDLLNDFLAEIQKPRTAIAARSASNSQLVRLMDDLSEMLAEQLDPVMLFYSLNDTELYDYYRGVRGIDQSGGGTQPDVDTSITLSPLQYFSSDQTQDFTANTRIVIKHQSPGAAALIATFYSIQNLMGPVQQTINPGTTLDTTAGALGFGGGNNWFTIYNSGSPVSASVALTINLYY